MNDSSSSDRLATAEGLAGIIGLIRRVCLHREQGEAAAANRLQNGELGPAITQYRLAHGPASLTEDQVCALFLAETEHIREAMILVELMVPQLARRLPAAASAPAAVFPAMPPGRAAITPIADGPPAITDLLDAMLAAERPRRL